MKEGRRDGGEDDEVQARDRDSEGRGTSNLVTSN